jgi:hypothetical protein
LELSDCWGPLCSRVVDAPAWVRQISDVTFEDGDVSHTYSPSQERALTRQCRMGHSSMQHPQAYKERTPALLGCASCSQIYSSSVCECLKQFEDTVAPSICQAEDAGIARASPRRTVRCGMRVLYRAPGSERQKIGGDNSPEGLQSTMPTNAMQLDPVDVRFDRARCFRNALVQMSASVVGIVQANFERHTVVVVDGDM